MIKIFNNKYITTYLTTLGAILTPANWASSTKFDKLLHSVLIRRVKKVKAK